MTSLPDHCFEPGAPAVPAGQAGDELYAAMDEILARMERSLRRRGRAEDPVWRSGDFVAGAMMEFKARAGDGRLGDWRTADVRRFLLSWFPRTVLAPPGVIEDVPTSAAGFLRFLADQGWLTGDSLNELETLCGSLHEDFVAACADSALFSPGKTRLVQMELGASPANRPPARARRRLRAGDPPTASSSSPGWSPTAGLRCSTPTRTG